MAITEISTPYEFLARWNGDGTYQGAHIQYLNQIARDGVCISATAGEALPVSDAGDDFRLTDIVGLIVVSQQAAIDDLRAQIAALTAAHEAQIAALKTASEAQIAALTNDLAKSVKLPWR